MKDRVKLKKLVQFIGDLIKVEGNEWLIDEILKTIGETSPIEEIAKHSVIQNIHEFCIEKKIEKQAIDFYYSFPIQEIKKQLTQDYQKMEHERRRDDFENFSLCLYQQIENITNFLFDFKIESNWGVERNNVVIKSLFDETERKYIIPNEKGTTLEQLVFQGTDSSKWFANRKFRAVLYHFYFNKNVVKDDYEFNSIYYVHEEIYQIRNQNHRGGKSSPYQKITLDKIRGNESRYYFKFYGFLQDFVNHIELNFINNQRSTNRNVSHSKKSNPQKNTLGEIYPEFEKLKQIMDKK